MTYYSANNANILSPFFNILSFKINIVFLLNILGKILFNLTKTIDSQHTDHVAFPANSRIFQSLLHMLIPTS